VSNSEPKYSMREVLSPLVVRMLAGVGLNALGGGLTMALLLVYLTQIRDISTAQATVTLTLMAIVSLLITGPVGTLVDRFGPQPVMLVGLIFDAIAVGMWSQVHNVRDAYLVGIMSAIGGSTIWPPQSAMIARITPPENRQRVYGIQFMLLNAGLGLGGVIGSLMVIANDAASFERLYYLNAASYLFYFLIMLTMKVGRGPETHQEEELSEAGYKEVFKDRVMVRLTLSSLLLLTAGYASIEAGLALFATIHVGLSPNWLGVIYGANTATIVLAQTYVLKWSHRKSRSRLLTAVGFLWAFSWLVVAIAVPTGNGFAVILLCLSQFIFALGETLWSPIAPALANELAPAHLRGRYNALSSLQWNVANAIGPLIAAATLGQNLPYLWIGTLLLGCLVAAFLMSRLGKILTPQQDGQVVA
jgi:MFS family permease